MDIVVKEEIPPKKYKCIWKELISEDYGDKYLLKRTEIIEAYSEDHAYDIWYCEFASEDSNGLDDLYEVIEDPILKRYLLIDMPDGLTYSVPVEFIAKRHASHYAHTYNNDEAKSLTENTLHLFKDEKYIMNWARHNLKWKDVKSVAIVLQRKVKNEDYENAWNKNLYTLM